MFILSQRAEIAYLKTNKAFIEVFSKYANFANIFSPKLAVKLFKYININDQVIELIVNQQCLYYPIYSLGPIKLKTLKAYIENNLANDFIKSSKFPAEASIYFDQKLDRSLNLCVDYQGLNNLTIKNKYPLLLVGESLKQLDWAWCFI